MGEVGEADSGKSEVLEVDERNRVAVEEGDVCRVDVEDVVGRLLNVQALEVRTWIDQTRKVEVVGGNLKINFINLTHEI